MGFVDLPDDLQTHLLEQADFRDYLALRCANKTLHALGGAPEVVFGQLARQAPLHVPPPGATAQAELASYLNATRSVDVGRCRAVTIPCPLAEPSLRLVGDQVVALGHAAACQGEHPAEPVLHVWRWTPRTGLATQQTLLPGPGDTYPRNTSYECLGLSVDGRFAAQRDGGNITLWDLTEGEALVGTALQHAGHPPPHSARALAFSPDSRRVATVGNRRQCPYMGHRIAGPGAVLQDPGLVEIPGLRAGRRCGVCGHPQLGGTPQRGRRQRRAHLRN